MFKMRSALVFLRPLGLVILVAAGFSLLLFIISIPWFDIDLVAQLDLNADNFQSMSMGHQFSIASRVLKRNRDSYVRLVQAANSHRENGEHEEAILVLRELHQLQCVMFGPEDAETVTTLEFLARQTFLAKKHDAGLAIYWQVYRIKEKTLGPTHPDTLTTLQSLAFTYYKKGNFKKAVDFSKVVYRHRKNLLGPEHLETMEALFLFGDSLQAIDQRPETIEKVIKYFERVYKVYLVENEETLPVLFATGRCLVALKRNEEAVPLLRTVMKRLATEKMKTSQSALYEQTEKVLSLALTQLGRTEEARQVHKTARRIKDKRGKEIHDYGEKIQAGGKFTPEVEDQINTVLNLATVAMAEENFENALKKLEGLYSITENDHPQRLVILHSLMEVQGALGNFKEEFDTSVRLFHEVQKLCEAGDSDYCEKLAYTWQSVSRALSNVATEHPAQVEEFLGPKFEEISRIFVDTLEFRIEDQNNLNILKILAAASWVSDFKKREIGVPATLKLLPILKRQLDAGPQMSQDETEKNHKYINFLQTKLDDEQLSSGRGKNDENPNHMNRDEL